MIWGEEPFRETEDLDNRGPHRYLRVMHCHGVSGHGSKPRLDNAIVHLAAAVAKIGEWQPPMRLNETTRTFFKRLAAISPPEEAFMLAHVEDPKLGPLRPKGKAPAGTKPTDAFNRSNSTGRLLEHGRVQFAPVVEVV